MFFLQLSNFVALLFVAGPAPPNELPTLLGDDVVSSEHFSHNRTRVAQRAQKHQPPNRAKLAAKRAKIRQRLRALRAWELTEALDLDEQSAAKLFPILNRFDNRFQKALDANSALRRETRKALRDPNTNPKKIDALVGKMLKKQRELWDLQEERFREVRKLLTPRQTARIVILLPEIDRKLHRQVRQVMRKRGKPGRPGRPNDRPHPPPPPPIDPFA